MRAPLTPTVHGRRAVASPSFRLDLLKAYRTGGVKAAQVFIAITLVLADENGVAEIDPAKIVLALRANAAEIDSILAQALTVN